MNQADRAYEQLVTNGEWRKSGYAKFDGYQDGTLIDAKNQALKPQAKDQVRAAGDVPIICRKRPTVSYSPSIYKFAEGSDVPVPLDLDLVRSVLDPYDVGDPTLTVMEDGGLQFWVRASDGSGAEIFVDETGILVERPHSGTGVFVSSPNSPHGCRRSSSNRVRVLSSATPKRTHIFRRP